MNIIKISDKNITLISGFINSTYIFFLIASALLSLSELDLAIWFSLIFFLNINNLLDFGLSNNILRTTSQLSDGVRIIPKFNIIENNKTQKKLNKILINQNLTIFYKKIFFYRVVQFLLTLVPFVFILNYFFYERLLLKFEPDIINLIFLLISISLYYSIASLNTLNFRIGIGKLYHARILEILFNISKMIIISLVILFFKDILIFLFSFVVLNIIYFYYQTKFLKNEINYKKRITFKNIGFSRLLPNIGISGLNSLSAFILFQVLNLITIKFGSNQEIISYSFLVRVVNLFRTVSFSSIIASLNTYSKNRINNVSSNSKLFFRDLIFSLKTFTFLSFLFLCFVFVISFMDINIHNLKNYLMPFNLILYYLFINFLELHQSCHNQFLLTKNYNPFLFPSLFSSSFIAIFSFMVFPTYGFFGSFTVQLIIQLFFNHWYSVYLNASDLGYSVGNYYKYLIGIKKNE